jgi:N4-(beta-N-acetylglucosaminyl)-L-asparaginase
MKPIVISTWKHGINSNIEAYRILSDGGNSLDAVEAGVKVAENDPKVLSVGFGGLPDCEGRVTLDAALMDWNARAGAVLCLENIRNPINVARLVLEETEHVMLAGEGALEYAILHGFKPESLLTDESTRRFSEWKAATTRKSEEIHTDDFELKKSKHDNINKDGYHDTIGMLAIDRYGNISAACTTSGMAWKLHGRVGDSPIVGAGLYVDGEAGGAIATGRGEECVRACGSFLIVELMRNGASPFEACKKACERVYKLNLLSSKNRKHIYQVAFIALNKDGEYGVCSVRDGFQYGIFKNGENKLIDSIYLLDENFDEKSFIKKCHE